MTGVKLDFKKRLSAEQSDLLSGVTIRNDDIWISLILMEMNHQRLLRHTMTWLCWEIRSYRRQHICASISGQRGFVVFHLIGCYTQKNPAVGVDGTSALHHLVDLALYVKLRVFGLHTFQLDGYFLSNNDVGAYGDVTTETERWAEQVRWQPNAREGTQNMTFQTWFTVTRWSVQFWLVSTEFVLNSVYWLDNLKGVFRTVYPFLLVLGLED